MGDLLPPATLVVTAQAAKMKAGNEFDARNYLERISELVDTSIGMISVGANRSQTFYV